MAALKVLVLGAGASMAYGYPSGYELRAAILSIREDVARELGLVTKHDFRTGKTDFSVFQDAFRASMMYSIDAFLARRKEFSEVGKKCIARVLLKCENPKPLFKEEAGKDHWYQYFLNYIVSKDWSELSFDEIALVTFNYDRSLEHFLLHSLQNAYGKSQKDVIEKLKTLRIVHVYGSVCDKWPDEDGYFPYDGTAEYDEVKAASANLKVIPENRIDSPTLITARTWLKEARSICFLGFGFDPLNVERLADDAACALNAVTPQGHVIRTIVGTCKGMAAAEITSAYAKLTGGNLVRGNGFFHDTNCTQALRETLFLA